MTSASGGLRRLRRRLSLLRPPRLLPRTLLNRVFLLFGATLTLILAGGLGAFLSGRFQSDIEEANVTATMLVEIVAQSIGDAALVNDHDAIRRTLRAAVLRTPFQSARFIEIGGPVLEEHSTGVLAGHAPMILVESMAARLPDVNRVIGSGGRDYGVLRLSFNVNRLAVPTWSMAVTVLAIGGGGLVLGLVLTRLLLARWLSHLDHLGEMAAQIRSGQVDVRAAAAHDAPEEVRRAIEQFTSATGGLGQRLDRLAFSLDQHKMATDQAVIVIEVEPGGAVSYVNPLFCAVSGYPRETMLGSTGSGWAIEPRRYRDHLLAAPRSPVWHGEVACRHAQGHLVWMQRAAVPIQDESGELLKFICLDIDISAQKEADARLHAEKERAEVTLHSIADGVVTLDTGGRVTYANPAAQRILKLEPARLLGALFFHVLEVLDRRATLGAGAASERCKVRLPNGALAAVDLSRAPIHLAHGAPGGEVIAFRDVTREHRARQELKRLSLAVEFAASAIFITDPEGRIEYANPTFTRMTGYTFEEVRGRTPGVLKSGQSGEDIYREMWGAMRAGQTWRGELLNRRRDGSLFWCAVTLSAVVGTDGRVRQFVSVMEDASERKAAESTIHRLAYFDTLTALPNRRMFMERAMQAVKAARTAGAPLGICYLDLDGFKNINDTLGHHSGDLLLAEVARRLKSCLRPDDFLGRLGGDEFALLLHDAASPARVAEVGQALIAAMEEITAIDDQEIRIGTSVGVAMFPEDGQDVADLLRKADIALYQAKELGKRRLVFFSGEIEERKRQRAELESALAMALERQQFHVVYQPKVDLHTLAVTGAEALLRWHHPQRGIVPPDTFIPLAEETRLIVPIGRWVIEQACRQLRAWTAGGLSDVRLAVNIASVQFRSPGLAEDVERIVRDAGIDPAQLELEITESGLMEDAKSAATTLERLRRIGLTVAIDDFGTGYSSLAYLKAFPVSVLKIDRSFVRDLEVDINDRAIAEAVISMARVLKVDVVAEGVETPGQVRILQEMGCQLAQGYYFGKPMSAEAFSGFWRRHRESDAYAPTDFEQLPA